MSVGDNTVIKEMFADYESVLSAHRNLMPSSSVLQRQLDECEDQPHDSYFKSNYMSTESNLSRKRQNDVKLISANCKIARLEMKVNDLEISNGEAKIEMETQIEAIRNENQLNKHRREEMEVKLVTALQAEAMAKQELAELKVKLDNETSSWSFKYRKLEQEFNELKDKYDEETNQLNEAVFVLESDLNSVQIEKESLQNELERCEERLNQFTSKSLDLQRLLKEEIEWVKEKDLFLLKIKELEDQLKQHEEDIEFTKILRRQVSSLPELEAEVRRLKEENRSYRLREDNVLLLKERLANAESSMTRLQKQNETLQRLQSENEMLQSQLTEWRTISLVGRPNEPKSAVEVAKAVAELQQDSLLSLEKVGNVTSRNLELEKLNVQLGEEVAKLKLKCQKQEVSLKQNSDHLRHLQRKLLLVSKERDLNRQLMDYYEKDMTINLNSDPVDKINKMESIVENYRTVVAGLETELATCREQLVQLGFNSKDYLDNDTQMKSMKQRISELEAQVLELSEAKKALELKVEFEMVKGESNPSKTRIIHLSSNPISWVANERCDELEQLKKENTTLKERVKVLEEEGALAQDVTLRVAARLEQQLPEQVIEELKKQLVNADLQTKRVKETFKRFSSEFREVAYKLLGYKIEQPCNNQFKLSSCYAHSAQDYLLFSKSEDGSMQLLETPFSSYLADKISLYLHTHHSIPAFLSANTLDLAIIKGA